MSNVVIIGAGRTGRGYIARQISTKEHKLIFLDKNVELIQKLNEKGKIEVSYYGNSKKSLVSNYEAYVIGSPEGREALKNAEYIFTSVGEQNLEEVAKEIKKERNLSVKQKIITGENGISPKRKLVEVLDQESYEISEAIIFCTTNEKNEIDIISEDLDYLPYDSVTLTDKLPFYNFIPEKKFHDLLQRKIYTYNCLSACISYFGNYLGYKNYAEAANDEFIFSHMKTLKEQLTEALSKKYQISTEEQNRFGDMAIQKFINPLIEDTIERNGRNVKRKLGTSERILAPTKILEQYDIDTKILNWIGAAAMYYGCEKEDMGDEEVKSIVRKNCENELEKSGERMIAYFQEMRNVIDLTKKL